jgi:hypothetical protein
MNSQAEDVSAATAQYKVENAVEQTQCIMVQWTMKAVKGSFSHANFARHKATQKCSLYTTKLEQMGNDIQSKYDICSARVPHIHV